MLISMLDFSLDVVALKQISLSKVLSWTKDCVEFLFFNFYYKWHHQWQLSAHFYHGNTSPDRVRILVMEIRWSCDRLIYMMGIPILIRRHFYNESAPACQTTQTINKLSEGTRVISYRNSIKSYQTLSKSKNTSKIYLKIFLKINLVIFEFTPAVLWTYCSQGYMS